jgi:hypothetical protein
MNDTKRMTGGDGPALTRKGYRSSLTAPTPAAGPSGFAPAREAALRAIARYNETKARVAAMEPCSGDDYPAWPADEASDLWEASFNLAAAEAIDAEEALIRAILTLNDFDRGDVMLAERKLWPGAAIRHAGRVYLVVHNRERAEGPPEDAPIDAVGSDQTSVFVFDAARVVDLADVG